MIVVGGAPVTEVQYELIGKQFECMGEYLEWDIKFIKSYSASKTDDLKKNEAAMAEIKELANL